jgi:hypothetical protein
MSNEMAKSCRKNKTGAIVNLVSEQVMIQSLNWQKKKKKKKKKKTTFTQQID